MLSSSSSSSAAPLYHCGRRRCCRRDRSNNNNNNKKKGLVVVSAGKKTSSSSSIIGRREKRRFGPRNNTETTTTSRNRAILEPPVPVRERSMDDEEDEKTEKEEGDERRRRKASSSAATSSRGSSLSSSSSSSSSKSSSGGSAKIVKTDFLVIGSGIAGLSFALEAAEHGKVAIVTKSVAHEASTAYAQGGISAVISHLDTVDEHVNDTVIAGDYLCDEHAVRALCADGKSAIEKLVEIGTRFTKAEELEGKNKEESYQGLHLCREGGHGKPRIVHCDDMTGKEVERALVEATRRHPNVTFYEHHACVDLMASSSPKNNNERRCVGAVAVSSRNSEEEDSSKIVRFYASTTLLACGGAGQLFPSTTNPVVCTGDGIGMAARANVLCENLEFVQFHPTALYADNDSSKSPAKKLDENENAFLITEAVRGHGGELWTHFEGGERFMPNYDSRNELAPRDVVARAIHAEMRRNNSPCVYLDITKKDAEDVAKNFPGIYKELKKRNLDMTKQRIPVRPAAHYLCGGVKTNVDGETSLSGLFACGEVACTGVHGANRLASNSLLEGVVFARRAVKTATKKSRESLKQLLEDEFEDIVDEDDFLKCSSVLDIPRKTKATKRRGQTVKKDFLSTDAFAQSLRKEVQLSMWRACGIVRRTEDMRETLVKFKALQRLIEEEEEEAALLNSGNDDGTVTLALVEAKNLLAVGTLVLRSALKRKESRGLHYVVEYPDRVEEERVSTVVTPIENDDNDESSNISSSFAIKFEGEEGDEALSVVKQEVVAPGPR